MKRKTSGFLGKNHSIRFLILVVFLTAAADVGFQRRAWAVNLGVLEGAFARLLMRELPSGRALANLVTSYRGAEVNEGLYAHFLQRLGNTENATLRPVLAAQIEEIQSLYRAHRETAGRPPELAAGEVPTSEDLALLQGWARERFENEQVVELLVVSAQLLRPNEIPPGMDIVATVRNQIRDRFERARNGETLFGESMHGDLIGTSGLTSLPRARHPSIPSQPAATGIGVPAPTSPALPGSSFSLAVNNSEFRVLRWWINRGMQTELPRMVERVESATNAVTRWWAQRALRTRLSRELMALFKVYGVDVGRLNAQPWFAALPAPEKRQLLQQALEVTDNYLRLLKVPTAMVRLQWQLEAYTRVPPDLLVRLNGRTHAQLNAFRDGIAHASGDSSGAAEQFIDIDALLTARLEVARGLGLSQIVTEAERAMLETIQKMRTLGGGRVNGNPQVGSISLGERNIRTLTEEIQELRTQIAESSQGPAGETAFAQRSRELHRAQLQSRLDAQVLTLEQTQRELHTNLQEFAENFEMLRLFINLRSGLMGNTRVRPISMPDAFVVTQIELDEWRSQIELAMENYLRPHELMLLNRRQVYESHLRGETRAFVRQMYQWNIETVGKLFDPTLTRERLEEYVRNTVREQAQAATRRLLSAQVGRFTVGSLLGGGTATTAAVGLAGAGADYVLRRLAARTGIDVPGTPLPGSRSNPSSSQGSGQGSAVTPQTPAGGNSVPPLAPASRDPLAPASRDPLAPASRDPLAPASTDPSLPPSLPPEVLEDDPGTPPRHGGGTAPVPPAPVDPFSSPVPASVPDGGRD